MARRWHDPAYRPSGAPWAGAPGCICATTEEPRDDRAQQRLPGDQLRARSAFKDAADFNRQLTSWLVKPNHRIRATTKVRPTEAAYDDPGASYWVRRHRKPTWPSACPFEPAKPATESFSPPPRNGSTASPWPTQRAAFT
jgi:hypothetical protein